MQNEQIKSDIKVDETLKAALDAKPKKRIKKKEKLVWGEFKNWEAKGGGVKFSYSMDKKPAINYTFEDGKKYKITVALANHINSCCYPVNEYIVDKDGKAIDNVETMVKRYAFISTDFGDSE